MGIYQKIYQNYIFPTFETYKGRDTANIYANVHKSQWNSLEEHREKQIISLKNLLHYAQENSPYYRQVFADCGFFPGQLASLGDYFRIPILTKDLIRQNFDNLVCGPYRSTLWRKSTGGSTGQPLHFGYTKESYEWRVAMSKRGYSWAGASPGTKQAYIWGVQLGDVSYRQKIKEQIHHFIDRQKFFNCFKFYEAGMKACLTSLNKWQPQTLIGYTNPLYEFALFVESVGGLNFTPQSVLCAAERVHSFQRKVLERVFGCPVFNTYGSREFMLIASECEKHEGLHVSMENLIVEVVDDDDMPVDPGEVGRILVTDLHNYGMPFIRYEIGDLARVSDRQCSCGRGLMLLDDIVGRSLDIIHTPEGKTVPGEFFPHLMKDFPEIYRFQIIQQEIDSLDVKYVKKEGAAQELPRKLNDEIRAVVGPSMKINYLALDEIPLTPSGKHRVTVSNLP